MTRQSTPTERSLQASAAAHAMHARHDSKLVSEKGRAAAFRKFEDQVDPDRTLPEAERIRRAKHAQRAHMKAISLKAAQAKRRRREATA